MATAIWVNLGSGIGFLPDGTKPLKSSDIHIRTISHEMPQPSITKICLKITYIKFHSNFPRDNELIKVALSIDASESNGHSAEAAVCLQDTWDQGWLMLPQQQVVITTIFPEKSTSIDPSSEMIQGLYNNVLVSIWNTSSLIKWHLDLVWSVWYKIKFGSQILATNFGVFFMIYVMLSEICSMWV